jgi:hypothetical protein
VEAARVHHLADEVEVERLSGQVDEVGDERQPVVARDRKSRRMNAGSFRSSTAACSSLVLPA